MQTLQPERTSVLQNTSLRAEESCPSLCGNILKWDTLRPKVPGYGESCGWLPKALDLKMRTRMFSDFASELERQSQTRKCMKSTSAMHGVRFCGSHRSSSGCDTIEKIDKYVGRKANFVEFNNILQHFFTT